MCLCVCAGAQGSTGVEGKREHWWPFLGVCLVSGDRLSHCSTAFHVGQAVQQVLRPACLWFPNSRIISLHQHSWLFNEGSKLELRSSCLGNKYYTGWVVPPTQCLSLLQDCSLCLERFYGSILDSRVKFQLHGLLFVFLGQLLWLLKGLSCKTWIRMASCLINCC